MKPENYCRFTGILKDVKLKEAPDGSWILGKAELFLPDPTLKFSGQTIRVSAWNLTAQRMHESRDCWVTVICSFSTSTYIDKIYPNFDVDSFVTHE